MKLHKLFKLVELGADSVDSWADRCGIASLVLSGLLVLLAAIEVRLISNQSLSKKWEKTVASWTVVLSTILVVLTVTLFDLGRLARAYSDDRMRSDEAAVDDANCNISENQKIAALALEKVDSLRAVIAATEAQISFANRDALEAKTKASLADERTALAEKETAKLLLKVEKEIAARKDRYIPEELMNKVIESLKPASSDTIQIIKNSGSEVSQFVESIKYVLKEGGWQTREYQPSKYMLVTGQLIMVNDTNDMPAAAVKLNVALFESGYMFPIAQDTSVARSKGMTVIGIGDKPAYPTSFSEPPKGMQVDESEFIRKDGKWIMRVKRKE